MFVSSTLDSYTIEREYKASPGNFLRGLLENLYSKQLRPENLDLQQLAEGIMGREWVRAGCPRPQHVAGMMPAVPFDGSVAESFDTANQGLGASGADGAMFKRGANGQLVPDMSPPNRRAMEQFMFVQGGKLNSPLLEAWAKQQLRGEEYKRKTGHRSSLLEEEAVKHAHFTNIVGQIYFNEILNWYTVEPDEIAAMIPTKNSNILLEPERIGGTTTIGDVFDTTIPERGLYKKFGVGENWIEVGPKAKRGGIIEITKEAIMGNKTGDLLDACKTLGNGLKYNLANRGIDAIIDENAGAKSALAGGHRYRWRYTDYATYQTASPWINKITGNGLVDITNVNTAWKTFMAITDPASGEPIQMMPKELLVTTEKYLAALEITKAKEVRRGDITSGDGRQTINDNLLANLIPNLTPKTSQRFTFRTAVDTDWYLADVAKACRRYVVWDLTPETYGAGTSADIYYDVVQILKFSLMDIFSVVEPRALQMNVA